MAEQFTSEAVCPNCHTPLPPGTPPVTFDPGTLGPSDTGGRFIFTCPRCDYEGPFEAPDHGG